MILASKIYLNQGEKRVIVDQAENIKDAASIKIGEKLNSNQLLIKLNDL